MRSMRQKLAFFSQDIREFLTCYKLQQCNAIEGGNFKVWKMYNGFLIEWTRSIINIVRAGGTRMCN